MLTVLLAWTPVALLLAASVGLFLSRDWRWGLIFLAAQYLGMFWLMTLHWPFGLTSIKLVTGWMAAATLGVTRPGLSESEPSEASPWPQGRLFRLFIAAIAIVLVVAATPQAETMIPGVGRPVLAGGLLLAGMGLIQLGVTADILKITFGLLTFMAGFEILYATVETSILLAGLLSIVNLGLALSGAYLLTAAPTEEAEEEFPK